MKLDKYLTTASLGTKHLVRTYIKEGNILVNNQIITDPTIEINQTTDIIKFLGETVINTGNVYYMFHKPAGCITARKDPNKKTVLDYFDHINTNGLFPVGRLDKNTEGLLFLTNDGEFNHKLMCPGKHVEKKYFFWAFGSLDSQDKIRIETGINIRKDEPQTKPAKLEISKEGKYHEVKDELNIEELIQNKKALSLQPVVSGYLTISEGRKHQVKRMLKAVGCNVFYLKRISIGEVVLDESLEKGQYRPLTEKELQTLVEK